MRTFNGILFDCDGVLLDSEPMGCGSLAIATTNAGIPMTPTDAIRIFSGNSAQASLAWFISQGLDGQAVFDDADRILFEMFDRNIPHIPGIERVLSDFDVPKAVCSNSLIRRLDRSISRTQLAQFFNGHIYSAEHVARAKPAPDLALFAAQKLGIDPKQAIFIDDNPHGLECGIAAGCLAVGFVGPSDHRTDLEQKLRDAGAHYVVHGMDDFHNLLTDLSLPIAI